MKPFRLGSAGFLAWCLFPFGLGDLSGVPAPKEKYVFIDLQAKANRKREDPLGRLAGNNLAELAKGERTCGGVKFRIGEKVIQVYGTQLTDRPTKVEGIAVGKTFTKLHLLHATAYRAEDNTVIASYTVHYVDKTKATIEMVYGKDVRDWLTSSDPKEEASRAKVAWEGTNAYLKNLNNPAAKVRLFLSTWKNPHPKKKVVSIDFTSAKTISAPFCVAMTLETK
jgi:hypothetical protein